MKREAKVGIYREGRRKGFEGRKGLEGEIERGERGKAKHVAMRVALFKMSNLKWFIFSCVSWRGEYLFSFYPYVNLYQRGKGRYLFWSACLSVYVY